MILLRYIVLMLVTSSIANVCLAQRYVTISGQVKEQDNNSVVSYANVTLHHINDTSFVSGTITDEEGRYVLSDIQSGNYLLKVSLLGYKPAFQELLVGKLSSYLDLGTISLQPDATQLDELTITAKQAAVSGKMDKKVFDINDNISQVGGSVLDAMKNLPGVNVGQDGKVLLRGNDKVVVLIDGKQTALTGFGGQNGLDNLPASAIEKIEVINNPSAKYDANGNAGIVNIIYKKEKQKGLNGKASIAGGLGALWIKKENYPTIRPQFQRTPKINPSLSLNYRKNKVNIFLQADDLYTRTLNKNEFVDRYYDDGTVIKQQTKRNRTTNLITGKTGIDWEVNKHNNITVSGLYSREGILDRGDEPFFNEDLSTRLRLWQFLEDEVKTTVTALSGWQHKFSQPGRLLNVGLNYTFHREDEQYYFTNIYPTYTGLDSFILISDETVIDGTIDYIQPLKRGKVEGGIKLRKRNIPINMRFIPGLNSPLDVNAGGKAEYIETIPAAYTNYTFESKDIEVEAGLRVEYVDVRYNVDPNHNTYKSDGYTYFQPFPNARFTYKLDDRNRLSLMYNRRVDRPNEVDIRVFPKYDDAEIIKVGNPSLQPQFTNSVELGYKTSYNGGYLYAAAYHKSVDATITRIATTAPGSTLIYNVFQNAGRSYNTGLELILSQKLRSWWRADLNLLGYRNEIQAFTVTNLYPVPTTLNVAAQEMFSGNVKLNNYFKFTNTLDGQLTAIYLAPDIIPQGTIAERFSIDVGLKKLVQKGKGELFLNVADIANTLRIRQEIRGNDFRFVSTNYYETQVFRVGYSYKF